MRCLYCITDVSIDTNTNEANCPKCGGSFVVKTIGHREVLADYEPDADMNRVEHDERCGDS